jgi:hypothetical protein
MNVFRRISHAGIAATGVGKDYFIIGIGWFVKLYSLKLP